MVHSFWRRLAARAQPTLLIRINTLEILTGIIVLKLQG